MRARRERQRIERDPEDFYLAKERLRDFRDGDAIPLSDLKAKLGLED